MTSKRKNAKPLVLDPLPSAFTTTSLVPWGGSSQALTKQEERILETGGEQQLVSAVFNAKAIFGQSKIKEIHEHGTLLFDETVSFVMDVKERSGRSREHQGYIDHFTARQIALLDQHMLKLIDISVTAIAHQVYLSPYPPPEPESRPGFLARLFGTTARE